MAATDQDYAQIEAARQRVSSLTQQAGDQMAGVPTFKDEVMARVRDARAARGMDTLSQDLGNATQRLGTYRDQLVKRAGDVDPLIVDRVSAQERGNILGQLASISNIMKERSGTLEEAIQGGANTLQAGAMKTKAMADAAATELQTLMQIVQMKQKEAQDALDEQYRRDTFNEGIRQFNVSEANKKTANNPTPLNFNTNNTNNQKQPTTQKPAAKSFSNTSKTKIKVESKYPNGFIPDDNVRNSGGSATLKK